MKQVLAAMAIICWALAGAASAGGPPPAADPFPGRPGVVVTDVLEMRAVVEAIDPAKRIVSLKGPQGRSFTLKADKAVANLNQIRKGDSVRVDFVESIVVMMSPADAPANAAGGRLVSVAPKGSKPAVLLAETLPVRAVVQSVDPKAHTISLKEAGGGLKTVPVDRGFKRLQEFRPGDRVMVRLTEALALKIEKRK
ncbi:MAG: hypothetical protein MUF46_06005 [Desulfobacterales bacterium]|nr:hypothetical protein [Desulfobacterales bacterium]